MSRSIPLGFSQSRQWKIFSFRHERFLQRLPYLEQTLNLAFGRTADTPNAVDKAVFLFGVQCSESFEEILFLCSEGLTAGAQTIVRSMFERAVTARYLYQHPDEAENLRDFYWVSTRKLNAAMRSA